MQVPESLLYTKEHEWIKTEADTAYIGVTDYAQDALGDIAYVEMPEIGAKLERESVLCTLESPKAVAEVFMPVDGVVIEVNSALEEEPGDINTDPYGSWLAKVQLSEGSSTQGLLKAEGYIEYLKTIDEAH
ncbi:MAG: glycine cleavage system protein GcvH [Eubacteriaceae bacterium]|nr:glycine cleavage system protein GcvH [Eubacteriaceae bacterium]